MSAIAEAIFGPLIVPECRRSAGRPWVMVVRCLAALAASLVVFGVLWWWWFGLKVDPFYRPRGEVEIGLGIVEGMAVVIALLVTPAILAGSLAGDKERGALTLLLTTRVNSWQIVTGRLGGKLFQVGMILLAGAPLVYLLAALADLPVLVMLSMAGLPIALAFGVGGISLAASSVFRRGRDALLIVYLFIFLGLPLSLMWAENHSPEAEEWVSLINPFQSMDSLIRWEDFVPALLTMLVWSCLGLLGLSVAAWRLRPACLGAQSGDVRSGRKRRRRRVPPVDERRPVLWKELYIERVSPLGRAGRWLGLLAFVVLFGAGLGYTGLIIYRLGWETRYDAVAAYTQWLGLMISGSAVLVGYLIQLAIGLRAAVAISSERERGTWEGILTSPLEGREIVVGKLYGSLYSLRWLIVAAIWAWTLAVIGGELPYQSYAYQLVGLFVIGGCLAAVGVRLSLTSATAAKSMAMTVVFWLVLMASFSILAGIIVGIGALFIQYLWITIHGFDSSRANPFAWWPLTFGVTWAIVKLGLYLLLTVLIVLESRYRFDRLAGRMTGGEAEVAVDQFLHGVPLAPVAIADGSPLPAPSDEVPSD
ncbi:MAG: hypothetical protein ABS79_01535 [Planctomycetes bacterium SCN 63-9]|nr:MAG: hypothetical protein ABS79_01535 [Planctomycetes bacterium SCN 63-9]